MIHLVILFVWNHNIFEQDSISKDVLKEKWNICHFDSSVPFDSMVSLFEDGIIANPSGYQGGVVSTISFCEDSIMKVVIFHEAKKIKIIQFNLNTIYVDEI